MSISDEMLKDAVKTADTIVDVRNKFDLQKAGLNQMLQGLQPPMPMTPRQKSSRVSSNEGMLTAENANLQQQIADKEEEIRGANEKTVSAYKIVGEFREEFTKELEGIIEKICDLQHKVYEAIKE